MDRGGGGMKKLTRIQRAAYFHNRGLGYSVESAYRVARNAGKKKPDDLADGDCVTLRGGYVARVAYTYDDCADYSYVGEFKGLGRYYPRQNSERVDSFGRNPDEFYLSDDRGDVCSFVPAEKFANLVKYYRDNYGRGTGYFRAIQQRKSELQEARGIVRNDRAQYVVSVEVSLNGIELGRACLGGVDIADDDSYLSEVARELIPEALDEAKKMRAKLCARRCKNH